MPKSKDIKGKKVKSEDSESRRKSLTKEGKEIPMPPIIFGEYLVGYLYEIGPVLAVGMGLGAITWLELNAWQECTKIPLTSWEARWLRRLSSEYLAEHQEADDIAAVPPWKPPQTEQRRAQLPSRLKDILRGSSR